MTQIEHDTYRRSACPCGVGEVTMDVFGTDYRHDKPKISFHLNCAVCSQAWHLANDGKLILIASRKPAVEAQTALSAALSIRNTLVQTIVTTHLSTVTFSTKKAEWEYLSGLGLWRKSYRVYTTERRRHEPQALADGFLNLTWLQAAASPQQREDLLRMAQLVDRLTEQREAAQKLIVTWPTRSMPSE